MVGPANGHRRKGMTGATGCLAQPGSTLTHNLCIKFKEKSTAAKIKSRKCFTCAPVDCPIQGSGRHQLVKRRSPTIGGHIPGPKLGKRNWVGFLSWAMARAIGNIRGESKYALLGLGLSGWLWCALSEMLRVKCHRQMYYHRIPSICTPSVNDDGKAGFSTWQQSP